MAITIELPPEMEKSLSHLAAERGISLSTLLRRLVEERAPALENAPLSPAERAAAWRESARKFPHTPLLSDEAISRESLYAEHW